MPPGFDCRYMTAQTVTKNIRMQQKREGNSICKSDIINRHMMTCYGGKKISMHGGDP